MKRKETKADRYYKDIKYILEYYSFYVNRIDHKDPSYSYICLCKYGTLYLWDDSNISVYHKIKKKDYDFRVNLTNQHSTYNRLYFNNYIEFILDYFHTLRRKGDPFAKRKRAKRL